MKYPMSNTAMSPCQAHVLQCGILVFVCIGDEKIVGAFHVVVEPCVDFYAALRASEFSPPEVIHVQADCRRVDKLQVLSFPSTFFAAQKLVVVEKMKIEVLENGARALLVCVRKVRPCDVRPYACVIEVAVAFDCILD